MSREITRSIKEITADLEKAHAASEQAIEVVTSYQAELVQAQTEAIGWDPDHPSPHAAMILSFARTHGLDPRWLGVKVGEAIADITWRHPQSPDSDTARTAKDLYKLGIYYLSKRCYNVAFSAFLATNSAAVDEEKANPDRVDPQERMSLFYQFLGENFAGALMQIIRDDHFNNY